MKNIFKELTDTVTDLQAVMHITIILYFSKSLISKFVYTLKDHKLKLTKNKKRWETSEKGFIFKQTLFFLY